MILIKGGKIIDPITDTEGILDILIKGEKIISVKKNIEKKDARIIDAKGKIVAPGLIDMHTHLREPGREDEETILTGTRSAIAGGFTGVVSMANTNPPVDNCGIVKFILNSEKVCDVYPVGAVTKGLKGEELAEIGDMVKAGCCAISDDGNPVMNSEIMRRALEYTRLSNIPVISHPEDSMLSRNGVMNEGRVSTRLGLRGIPSISEEIMVARDIEIAKYTGGKLHLAHLSTKGSVRLAREAKKRKIGVTCEATPHHFSLTEEECETFDTNYKMYPPLRTEEDVYAIKEGLRDGTIDAIATDHAPHADFEKELEFENAPNGVIGLQTALPCAITELIKPGILTMREVIEKFTLGPKKILNLPIYGIKEEEYANIVIIDTNLKWIPKREDFISKSKNSPFIGKELIGLPIYTIYRGKVYFPPNTV